MPPKNPPLPRPTHFLCLPLVTPSSRPQLQSSLSVFKTDVIAQTLSPLSTSTSTSTPRIPEKAIRPLGTLHLTIGVMNLETAEKLNGAIKILNSIFDDGDDNQNHSTNTPSQSKKSLYPLIPLPKITLRSLYSMHPPHSTSILYTSPLSNSSNSSNSPNHLQTFSEALKEKFTKAGFMLPEKEGRALLLHATIVNTIYISRGVERGKRRDMRRGEGEGGSCFGIGGQGERGTGEGGATKSHPRAREQTQNPTENKNININKQNTRTSPTGSDPHGSNPQTTGHSKPKARSKFDARDILSRYADFVWMRDVRIEKVAICRMGAKKREDGDEEYEVEAEVDVPWV
ncbi:hypothetical protein EAF04_002711 [Stromatinia cepivora]|nr:hypothetical protein EAF04_002711 [Stromatinia cepivora]